MKLDKDIQATTADAVYAVTAAAELFLEVLARESFDYARRDGRRSLLYRDVAWAVNDVQEFEFLTEIVPHTLSYEIAVQRRKALEELNAQPSSAAMMDE
ncbi:hypothetical protein BC831DRAFT_456230 [Entophlyctis helioformis]|nr:hypothetical protein BC831DRAFT_456230 [Entophlyctis helioformis]